MVVANNSDLTEKSGNAGVNPPTEAFLWNLLNQIPDPDIPVVSIVELGLVREVKITDKLKAEVTITPSYSGCPAQSVFTDDIKSLLKQNGFNEVEVKVVLSPAWTTDWLSNDTKEKMRLHGIAPPENEPEAEALFCKQNKVKCPRCGNNNTHIISRFGSTPCKALWYCNYCSQPFEYFKCF